MLSIALMMPFYVLFAQQQTGGDIAGLGIMVIASGLAAALSSPFWGVLGDRSSRRVMALAAAGAGLTGLCVVAAGTSGQAWLAHGWVHALVFMLLTVMHSGVRLGRKVYLVDMATQEKRAAYVALSNSVIGVAMLIGGLIGVLGDWLGLLVVIGLMSLGSIGAAFAAMRLPEVSEG